VEETGWLVSVICGVRQAGYRAVTEAYRGSARRHMSLY